MKYRQLGRRGPLVSEVGFGCGPLAGLMVKGSAAERRSVVRQALDAGVALFDTSPVYGSEANLGQTLEELGALDRTFIATKVALQPEDLGDITAAVQRSVRASLERLRRDRVEIIHLHNRIARSRSVREGAGVRAVLSVEDVLGPGGVLESLTTLRDENKVGVIGCSAYEGEPDAIRDVLESGRVGSLMIPYSLLNPTAVSGPPPSFAGHDYGGLIPVASALGIGVVVVRALEAGALIEDREDGRADSQSLAFLWRDARRTRVQSAIQFVLSRPEVATVVIGISEPSHLTEAAVAAGLGPLSRELLARVQAVHSGAGSNFAPVRERRDA